MHPPIHRLRLLTSRACVPIFGRILQIAGHSLGRQSSSLTALQPANIPLPPPNLSGRIEKSSSRWGVVSREQGVRALTHLRGAFLLLPSGESRPPSFIQTCLHRPSHPGLRESRRGSAELKKILAHPSLANRNGEHLPRGRALGCFRASSDARELHLTSIVTAVHVLAAGCSCPKRAIHARSYTTTPVFPLLLSALLLGPTNITVCALIGQAPLNSHLFQISERLPFDRLSTIITSLTATAKSISIHRSGSFTSSSTF